MGLRSARDVDPHRQLMELGLDSMMAVDFVNELSVVVGQELDATLTFDYPTMHHVATFILDEVLDVENLQVIDAPAVAPPSAPTDKEGGGQDSAAVAQLSAELQAKSAEVARLTTEVAEARAGAEKAAAEIARTQRAAAMAASDAATHPVEVEEGEGRGEDGELLGRAPVPHGHDL